MYFLMNLSIKNSGYALDLRLDLMLSMPLWKGKRVVILDQKFYDDAIQEIILDTSKFEKLSEDPSLKREASLRLFLCKLKHKIFFNQNEYGKLYPSKFCSCSYLWYS